jgi:hypothetical protein
MPNSSKQRKSSTRAKTLKRCMPVTTAKPTAAQFKQEIAVKLLEMLVMIKLRHWRTTNYAAHKATDEIYASLNGHMDQFIEVLLGKDTVRIDLMKKRSIDLIDFDCMIKFKEHIESFKEYLINLQKHSYFTDADTDLLNIRDEILGDLNQFTYLLSLC